MNVLPDDGTKDQQDPATSVTWRNGCMGGFRFNGNPDTCITIRTAL